MNKKIITIVSIGLFGAMVYASQSDSGSYKTITICSPGEEAVAIALDIREMIYADKPNYKTTLSTVVENGEKGASSAEAMVAIFLDARLKKDAARMKRLIYGEIRDPRQEELDRGARLVEKWAQIQLNRKWSYGDYHTVLMDQIAPDGHSEKSSITTIMINGKYYLAMDFPQEIRMLFGYMMGDESKGLIGSTDYSKLNHRLVFTQPNSSEQGLDNKLTVRINAKFNDFAEDWSEKYSNAKDKVSDFFCKARKITLDGTDEEFLSLWSGKEYLKRWSRGIKRPKIDRKLLEENYADFKRLRETYKNARFNKKQFKQVYTIDLGKYVVHYYLAKPDSKDLKKPETHKLKTIIFIKGDGKYYLSEGLQTNIRNFLTRGMVPKRILQMWQSQKG